MTTYYSGLNAEYLHVLIQDLDHWRADKQHANNPLQNVDSPTMLKAQAAAFAAVDALMLTDAPLLYSPSLLALAALRAGFRKVTNAEQVPCRPA